MKEEEKFCCITLDEMSISSAIEYDSSIGQIIGNVNLPHHAGQATHGLVFMLPVYRQGGNKLCNIQRQFGFWKYATNGLT